MTTATASWPSRAEHWLDDRGKGAWIAAMILAFVLFWPLGLALMAYMIWSKRLFSKGCARARERGHQFETRVHSHGFRSSGNRAFDAYKADTLDRLEREQEEFEAFLDRLRASKDKSEFDQYLDDRARQAKESPADPSADENEAPRGSY